MAFTLELSRTAQKALNKLPPSAIKRIWVHLEVYRLRIGRIRVEYEVYEPGNTIKIAKIFRKKRKSDYR